MINSYEIGRLFFSVIFVLGSITNALFLILHPSIYADFANLSILPLYRELWLQVVYPNIRFFLVVVVLFEMTVGICILSKGKIVEMALIASAVFMLLLIPFWWSGWALINLLFAIALFVLSRHEYAKSWYEIIKE